VPLPPNALLSMNSFVVGEKSIAKHLYLQWHYGDTNFTDASFIEPEILV
jgi:hypothetical protein